MDIFSHDTILAESGLCRAKRGPAAAERSFEIDRGSSFTCRSLWPGRRRVVAAPLSVLVLQLTDPPGNLTSPFNSLTFYEKVDPKCLYFGSMPVAQIASTKVSAESLTNAIFRAQKTKTKTYCLLSKPGLRARLRDGC